MNHEEFVEACEKFERTVTDPARRRAFADGLDWLVQLGLPPPLKARGWAVFDRLSVSASKR